MGRTEFASTGAKERNMSGDYDVNTLVGPTTCAQPHHWMQQTFPPPKMLSSERGGHREANYGNLGSTFGGTRAHISPPMTNSGSASGSGEFPTLPSPVLPLMQTSAPNMTLRPQQPTQVRFGSFPPPQPTALQSVP